MWRHGDALPDAAHAELVKHAWNTQDVIWIAVRQHQPFESRRSKRTQSRGDHSRTNVEARFDLCIGHWQRACTAGVDEQGVTVGQRHDTGIPLPHIEHNDPQR